MQGDSQHKGDFHMKRSFLIPLTILVLVSMACSMFSRGTEKPADVPTATQPPAVQAEKATAAVTEPPTSVPEEPTAAPQPTDTEAPVEVPTDTPEVLPTETEAGPVEIVDAFDHNKGDWSDDLVVTTQTSGRDLLSKGIIQDSGLRFSFDDKETYIYKFYNTPVSGNVTIKAEYHTMGHINNGIAIVCKVNEDHTAWFEVRVSSTSDFSFYLYDKKRKTDLGKNPYLQLGKGKFKINELYPSKPNVFQLTCLDDELILNANNDKRIVNQGLDVTLDGDGVGVGAMSYDVTPINIIFDKITIRQED
jgi:hypothetical protein